MLEKPGRGFKQRPHPERLGREGWVLATCELKECVQVPSGVGASLGVLPNSWEQAPFQAMPRVGRNWLSLKVPKPP